MLELDPLADVFEDVFGEWWHHAQNSATRSIKLMVLEGIDGAGKTTLAEAAVRDVCRTGNVNLQLLRVGQRDQIPAPLAKIYHNQILSVVASADSLVEAGEYLLEFAELDALLYKIRLRAITKAQRDGYHFLSESWSYRRFCKFSALAYSRLCDCNAHKARPFLQSLLQIYAPTFVADSGILLVADPKAALGQKDGKFTPWEIVPLLSNSNGSDESRFLELATATGQLLERIGQVLGWQVICREYPLLDAPEHSNEMLLLRTRIRAWVC